MENKAYWRLTKAGHSLLNLRASAAVGDFVLSWELCSRAQILHLLFSGQRDHTDYGSQTMELLVREGYMEEVCTEELNKEAIDEVESLLESGIKKEG